MKEQTWYALDGDYAVTEASSTPEGAAAEYFSDQMWDSHLDKRPESVTVARGETKTHAEYAARLGQVVAEAISSAMCDDGGEWSNDACYALDRSGDSLDALLAPVIEAWLKTVVLDIIWWEEVERREINAPSEEE